MANPPPPPRECPCKRLPLTLSSFTAAEYGDLHALTTRNTKIPVNRVDAAGNTPLHLAAQHGHTAVVAWLLQQPTTSVCGSSGATPLHRASFSGAVGTMRLLVLNDNRNNNLLLLAVDTSFGDGATALHKACAGGRYLAVQVLLDALVERGLLQAGLTARNAKGQTPYDVIQYILQGERATEEGLAVSRWNQVAGGKPDWKLCQRVLEQYMDNNSKYVDSHPEAATTEKEAPLPSHLRVGGPTTKMNDFVCMEQECGENGVCLTAKWEEQFRRALWKRMDGDGTFTKATCIPVLTETSTREGEPNEKSRRQTTPRPPAADKVTGMGRPCELCGKRSIALYKKEQCMVCRPCSLK